MSPRLLVASLFTASVAYAQAPGQWAEPPPSDYAPPAPPVAISVPEQRWSVGLTIGQTGLTPDELEYSNAAMDSAEFGGAALALRYRPWRHLELELTLGGGRQELEDGSEGDLAMGYGTLAARYRFNPHNKWNWWVLAGFGATTIARHDASDDELERAQRPHGTLGIGLEYRFTRFALQVEARAIRVGPTEDEQELIDRGAMIPAGASGGSLTLGASYYF